MTETTDPQTARARRLIRQGGMVLGTGSLLLLVVLPLALTGGGVGFVTAGTITMGTLLLSILFRSPLPRLLVATLGTSFMAAVGIALVASSATALGLSPYAEFTPELAVEYAVTLLAGTVVGAGLGLLAWVLPPREGPWHENVQLGGWIGLTLGTMAWSVLAILSAAAPGRLSIIAAAGAFVGLVVGSALGIVRGTRDADPSPPVWMTSVGYAVLVALFGGLVAGLITGLNEGVALGLSFGAVVGVLAGVTTAIGFLFGTQIRVGFTVFDDLWDYLKPMGVPVLGFAFVYLFVVVWFAALYALAAGDPAAFYREEAKAVAASGAAPDVSFNTCLYLSLMTLSTQGYSELTPTSAWTRWLVSIQSVVGTGLTVVMFAAVVAYLEPRFGEVRQRHKERDEAKRAAADAPRR